MTTPALPADVPLFDGWNVWDVLQATAPVDPGPGSLDDQLAAFVREAVGIADLPIALTSSAAAGDLITTRAQIPELAGEPILGVGGSGVVKKTIAFELPDSKPSIPWPHDDNLLLDAVYAAAPAAPPASPVASSGNTERDVQQASIGPLLLVIGFGLGFMLSRRKR